MEQGFKPVVNSLVKWALIIMFSPLYYLGAGVAAIGILLYSMVYVFVFTIATAIFHLFVFVDYLKTKFKERRK